jgi:hypothetical protein
MKKSLKKRRRLIARQAELDRLRRLEKKAFRDRHGRMDFYKYLNAVLEVYWKWKDAHGRKTRRDELAQLADLQVRANHTAMHVLVAATSRQDARVRSRWTKGLLFASKRRAGIERHGFDWFWFKWRSIANCARSAPTSRTEAEMARYDAKW